MAEHYLHPFTPADAEKAVLQIILARRMRSSVLAPELFSEPAWDFLLILFLARLRRQRMTMRRLARAAGSSETMAARWLDVLDRQGLLRRRTAAHGDERTAFVELSPGGSRAMQGWLERWIESRSEAATDKRVVDLLGRLHQDND
jgi:DNA-binding MarR family transcriptional regulator